jgi:hypothetical protein
LFGDYHFNHVVVLLSAQTQKLGAAMLFFELTSLAIAIAAALVAGWLGYRKFGAKAEKIKNELGV